MRLVQRYRRVMQVRDGAQRLVLEVRLLARLILVVVLTVLVVLGGGCAGENGEPEPRVR